MMKKQEIFQDKKIILSWSIANLLLNFILPTSCSVNKCHRPRCKCCPLLKEYKEKININNNYIEINENCNCTTENVVYILFCHGCPKFYIGKSSNSLSLRINLHRNHINNENYRNLFVSKHIYQCGNSKFGCSIIFKSMKQPYVLEKMEIYFITLLKPELNRWFFIVFFIVFIYSSQ